MATDARSVLREALSLSDDERADVAAELLASLEESSVDDPTTVHELWSQQIERRARRVMSGDSDGEDWDDLRRRLAMELTGE